MAADVSPSVAEREPPGPLAILFSFEGRVGRKTWWLWGVLALIGGGLVALALLRIAGMPARPAEGIVNLMLLWPALAVSAKRWHDRDKSAWWLLVNLVPVLGQLWALVENGFLRGSAGPNRFGPPEPH